ncbi:peptidoglycan DD-metalloendopeptidase family protein [Alkalibaculum sp. M08DMB]|uniref:Peptidoglycan DD-metalloendopeptidase family protein n=1 Tax=Alkalibaculum sporogenes TaxID=2655001 RepID=A0A6A7K6D9_9FIRM|nr:M23 family metallopeptidase [Alkalibaculum sporogenes]MPW24934.1 peptidoglycan DD-metalloendopeptidase family protein [Alkalibaculum sporogenes]
MNNYRRNLKIKRRFNNFVTFNKKLLLLIALFTLSLYLHSLGTKSETGQYKEYIVSDTLLFLFPTEGLITALDKPGTHENSKAVDIANEEDTPIFAAMDGEVIFSGPKDGYGNCIIISHDDNYSTLYAHLNSCLIEKFKRVKRGDKIGLMGSTGNSTGPHLHFEIRFNDKREVILEYFPFLETKLYVTQKTSTANIVK